MMGRSVWIAALMLFLQTWVAAGELPSTEGAGTAESAPEVQRAEGGNATAGEMDDDVVLLSPKLLRVTQGERAVFTYDANDEASEILSAHQGNAKGYTYAFDTKDMDPGKYTITLKVTDVTLHKSRIATSILYVEAVPGAPVTMPKLVGKQLQEVLTIIELSGLHVGKIEKHASKLEPGTVMAQSPKAGTTAKSGSDVHLVVAKAAPAYVKPKAVIAPKRLLVQQGKPARFQSRSTYGADTTVTETWSGPLGTGTGKSFDVDTQGLEPGSYTVKLEVNDAAHRVSDTAFAVLYVEGAAAPAKVGGGEDRARSEPGRTGEAAGHGAARRGGTARREDRRGCVRPESGNSPVAASRAGNGAGAGEHGGPCRRRGGPLPPGALRRGRL